MLGRKQDKQEDVEWLERGKELTQIDGLVRAWKHVLPEAFLKQMLAVLDSFRDRCTARADVKHKYQKKS